MKMAKYVYPAVFTPEEEGRYSVFFPDLEGCYTCGDDLKDAIFMAEDALAFMLYDCERNGSRIPEVSEVKGISVDEGEFINFVACDTLEYARMHNNKVIKKTLTIPEWLNDAATKAGVNFSQTLKEALLEKVNL